MALAVERVQSEAADKPEYEAVVETIANLDGAEFQVVQKGQAELATLSETTIAGSAPQLVYCFTWCYTGLIPPPK